MYEVGGAVRDQFLGKKSKDIDYAIEAPSFEIMKEFIIKELQAVIYLEHKEYLTIRGKIDKDSCDFVLCRKDGIYLDNRHPSDCLPGTIYDDLARRDFTMNAIAKEYKTSLTIDPYDGISDINNHLIRSVGNPYERFQEDALRIIRALRFSIVLGFDIESKTLDAVHDCIFLLDNIASERIENELYKMFVFNTIESIRLLHTLGKRNINYLFNKRTGIWLEPTMKHGKRHDH